MKIRGVVDDRDGGIARLTTDGAWALRLVLHPWRDAEGGLIDGRVIVSRCCRSNAELEAARAEQPNVGDLVEVDVDASASDDGDLFGGHGIAVMLEGFVVRSAELYG